MCEDVVEVVTKRVDLTHGVGYHVNHPGYVALHALQLEEKERASLVTLYSKPRVKHAQRVSTCSAHRGSVPSSRLETCAPGARL